MPTFLLRFPLWQRWLAAIGVLLAIVLLAIIFFPWNALREPINRHVSAQLGRRFEITRQLSVQLGRVTTVRAEAVEIANPEWADEPYLLRAEAAEFDIRLFPLLFGARVELPRIALTQPRIGLQIEPDGRRTWALSKDSADKGRTAKVGALLVDQGTVRYQARAQGADIQLDFSLIRESAAPLPLRYRAAGRWKDQPFTASGHAGGVLQLSKDMQSPFALEIDATAGRTRLQAQGTVTDLAELAGIDAAVDLQGQNLDDLYRLLGVTLPSTPPYRLRGQLGKQDKVWSIRQMQGLLGKSDISGALRFDQTAKVPLLSGRVASRVLDFADLGPVIGMAPLPASARAGPAAGRAAPAVAAKTGRVRRSGKVLPVAPLDATKLRAMNADVVYSAADIRHAPALPLDKGSVHIKLKAGVLQLEPLSLGVAGGTVAGRITIDGNQRPAGFSTRLDVRALQLNRLFPTVESTRSGFGRISGEFDLQGRGDSLTQMLGSASGNIAVLLGRGQISNILLEYLGLDGAEVIKFLVGGDRDVPLRCAAVAFDVRQGLMSSRAIVLDTSDTLITGTGQVNLASERLDLLFKPQPKDASILSLRSPLRIGGSFAAPTTGPQTGALVGRAALALGLAAINPLLALAATVETGPGENADCAAILKQVATPEAGGKPSAAGKKSGG